MGINTFNNQLWFLVRHITKHNILIIGRDMNAQIGKDGNNKFFLYNSLKRNGLYLAEFSLDNRIAYLNNKLEKRKKKQWTYTDQIIL